MANVLTTNPMTVDTAAVLTTSKVRVRKMVWAGLAANKALVIKDNNANLIMSIKSITGDPVVVDFNPPFEFNGLNATTVDASGVLHIFK